MKFLRPLLVLALSAADAEYAALMGSGPAAAGSSEKKIDGFPTPRQFFRVAIDKLADPIVHLLRNAVDHGLESPALRERLGKPRQGRVSLQARQDGARVVIEVSDDGAGVDLQAVRDKAVRKGLCDAAQAAAMSEHDVLELLFRPGFSTAAIITDVSGRGVGLDIVRQAVVDELRGELGIETRAGVGSTFRMRLPRSLAVVRTPAD